MTVVSKHFICLYSSSKLFFLYLTETEKERNLFLIKKVTAYCKVYHHSSKYYTSIDILNMHSFWAAFSCSQQESNIE